jgi:hypothetical protein
LWGANQARNSASRAGSSGARKHRQKAFRLLGVQAALQVQLPEPVALAGALPRDRLRELERLGALQDPVPVV